MLTPLLDLHAASPVFQRGQRVVCKPGVFFYESGIGEVKDVIDGNVIVYFENVGRATICMPSDLEAYAAPLAYDAASPHPGDYLAPELDRDLELIERGDYVRIERLVRRDDAPLEFGTIVRTRPDIQWALVRYENSCQTAWFWIDEVFLVLKAGAFASADAKTNAL